MLVAFAVLAQVLLGSAGTSVITTIPFDTVVTGMGWLGSAGTSVITTIPFYTVETGMGWLGSAGTSVEPSRQLARFLCQPESLWAAQIHRYTNTHKHTNMQEHCHTKALREALI